MYLAKVQEGKNEPQYLFRGRLVRKENATVFTHPSAAAKALEAFMRQRRGKITTDIVKAGPLEPLK